MKISLDEVKQQISYFMGRLYRQKLTTSLGGNISMRVNNMIAITPSQKDKDNLTESDILVFDVNEKLEFGTTKPSMEYRFHLSIYEQRKDVNAIIHSHPFWGTWLAITHIKPNIYLTDEALYSIRNIEFCNYALMGSERLSIEISKKIKKADVLILKNHGVVAVGNTLTEAIEKIEVLENIAHYTYLQNPTFNYKNIPKNAERKIKQMLLNRENGSL
jgi:L-fuculose-phosphate aldolase